MSLDHGYGYLTRYGHNSKIIVRAGQQVRRGQVIAFVGNTGKSTGPHLHYEVLRNGVPVNPQTTSQTDRCREFPCGEAAGAFLRSCVCAAGPECRPVLAVS